MSRNAQGISVPAGGRGDAFAAAMSPSAKPAHEKHSDSASPLQKTRLDFLPLGVSADAAGSGVATRFQEGALNSEVRDEVIKK